MSSITRSILIFIFCAAFGNRTEAQEYAHYGPGVIGIRDLSLGAPGVFITWRNIHYGSHRVKDQSGKELETIVLPTGDTTAVAARTDILLTQPMFTWVMPWKVLGGRIGIALQTGLSNTAIAARFTNLYEDQEVRTGNVGLRDIFFCPFLIGWNFGNRVDLTFGYGMWLPTGEYFANRGDNIGLGFLSNQFNLYSAVNLEQGKKTTFSTLLTYDQTCKKKGWDIYPGDQFSVEYGLMRTFFKVFDLGVAGAHLIKLQKDRGSQASTEPTDKARANSVGFQAGLVISENLSLYVRHMWEYGVRMRFEGLFSVLTFRIIPTWNFKGNPKDSLSEIR